MVDDGDAKAQQNLRPDPYVLLLHGTIGAVCSIGTGSPIIST